MSAVEVSELETVGFEGVRRCPRGGCSCSCPVGESVLPAKGLAGAADSADCEGEEGDVTVVTVAAEVAEPEGVRLTAVAEPVEGERLSLDGSLEVGDQNRLSAEVSCG